MRARREESLHARGTCFLMAKNTKWVFVIVVAGKVHPQP